MSMNRIFRFGLLVMTAAAGAVHAAEQAKFHLPFGARWGEVTLAPGDYKVALPEASLGNRQFVVRGKDVQGKDKTGYVQPLVADSDDSLRHDPNHSYLQLVKVNGTYFVAKYRSGSTGQLFSFAVPKQKREVRMAVRDVVNVGALGN
jgi:hypothetical protein